MTTPLKSVAVAFVAALLMTGVVFARDATYYPVSRITTGEGFKLAVVQPPVAQRDACVKANSAFTDALKPGCASCKVEAAQCRTKLSGKERDAAAGKPVAEYVVVTGPVRIIVTGKKEIAKAACEQLAAGAKRKDVKDAACVPPRASKP